MQIFVFGSGRYYEYYKSGLTGYQVLGILDNDEKKQGRFLDGYEIMSPDSALEKEFDSIFVLSIYFSEIYTQLHEMGVPDEKIKHYYELSPSDAHVEFHESKKKIALISHDLSIGGAQNCLLAAAEILVNSAYRVVLGSPFDGELKNSFLNIGVDVYIDERLRYGCMADIEWLQDAKLVFLNTMQRFYLLRSRNENIPVVWWLHEPTSLYREVDDKLLNGISRKNLFVYTVSEVADHALKSVWKGVQTGRLLYGIEDRKEKIRGISYKPCEGRIVFIVIGEICKTKGHDILLKAVSQLSDEQKAQCEFWFVGPKGVLYEDILKGFQDNGICFTFYGIQSHQDTLRLLEKADILICVSREESMSMAVTEAFMLEKPVIVSTGAGNAEYIQNEVNGFLFENKNPDDLAKVIKKVLFMREQYVQIGSEGRKVYEAFFRKEIFADKLKGIIEQNGWMRRQRGMNFEGLMFGDAYGIKCCSN